MTTEVLIAYVVGIIIGVTLTLLWQAHAASVRRMVWDFYAGLPEEYQ